MRPKDTVRNLQTTTWCGVQRKNEIAAYESASIIDKFTITDRLRCRFVSSQRQCILKWAKENERTTRQHEYYIFNIQKRKHNRQRPGAWRRASCPRARSQYSPEPATKMMLLVGDPAIVARKFEETEELLILAVPRSLRRRHRSSYPLGPAVRRLPGVGGVSVGLLDDDGLGDGDTDVLDDGHGVGGGYIDWVGSGHVLDDGYVDGVWAVNWVWHVLGHLDGVGLGYVHGVWTVNGYGDLVKEKRELLLV